MNDRNSRRSVQGPRATIADEREKERELSRIFESVAGEVGRVSPGEEEDYY